VQLQPLVGEDWRALLRAAAYPAALVLGSSFLCYEVRGPLQREPLGIERERESRCRESRQREPLQRAVTESRYREPPERERERARPLPPSDPAVRGSPRTRCNGSL
jgi:hypothetical protein